MKTSLFALLLSCFVLVAQTPPPPPELTPEQEQALRQALRNRASDTNAARFGAPGLRGPRTNNPAAPADGGGIRPIRPGGAPPFPGPGVPPPGAPLPGGNPPPGVTPPPAANPPANEPTLRINPSVAGTNAPAEEVLPAGTINFPATDLNQVLQIYAELVGRTVLRPTTLPAPTITLKTQTPLTKREAIQAFDAVLAMNGIAMINVGDKFVKALPIAQAGTAGQAPNKLATDQLSELGPYLTHVVQLKYTRPSELVQALQPFANTPNAILPIDTSMIVVLRDYTENVKRMLEMIKQVDVAVPAEFISEVIPIKYALASEIASALNSLSSGGGGTTVGSSGGGGGGGTRSMMGGTRGTMGGLGGTMGSGLNRGTYPGQMGTSPFGTQGTIGANPGATPGASGSFTDRLRNIIQRASAQGEIQVLGQTKIIADERTNSLLIFASKEDMKTIKEIVNKLDIVLAQVLIEAVIVEVTLDNTKNLGVSYLQREPKGSGYYSGIGAINNNNILSQSTFLPSGSGTNGAASLLPQGFSWLGRFGNDLDVTVTALAGDSRARILQRPRIQTSNAKQAQLFVGQSRPYPNGSYYGGASFGGYASIQQLQIGVSIDVTPLINPDGLVVMDIHQKIDSFAGNVTIQGVGDVPITSSKEAAASVAVRDRDTIILGGLIDTESTDNNSGVPYLKDIPLLGYLFRSSSKHDTRSELIVLIRPTVLPTPEVAALTAVAEKRRMPGVSAAESDFQKQEAKRLRAAEKAKQKEP